jgi:hypothetical protein
LPHLAQRGEILPFPIIASSTIAAYLGQRGSINKGGRIGAIIAIGIAEIGSTIGSVGFHTGGHFVVS